MSTNDGGRTWRCDECGSFWSEALYGAWIETLRCCSYEGAPPDEAHPVVRCLGTIAAYLGVGTAVLEVDDGVDDYGRGWSLPMRWREVEPQAPVLVEQKVREALDRWGRDEPCDQALIACAAAAWLEGRTSQRPEPPVREVPARADDPLVVHGFLNAGDPVLQTDDERARELGIEERDLPHEFMAHEKRPWCAQCGRERAAHDIRQGEVRVLSEGLSPALASREGRA